MMKTIPLDGFDIGDWVEFSHIVETTYTDESKRLLKSVLLDKPAIGRIVGGALRYEGTYSRPLHYYSSSYDDEQPYLKDMKGVWLWLVRTGLTNRPYLVRDEHIRLAEKVERSLPFRDTKKLKTE